MKGRFSQLIVAVLVLLPSAGAVVYVHRYSVLVPRLDEWLFAIPYLERVHHEPFPWWDLKSNYWEHPVFVSRRVFLLIARLTHYSTQSILYVNCFLLGVVALIWFLDHRRILRARGQRLDTRAALAFVPIVWLVFNARQGWIYVWCVTLTEMLSLSGIVLGLYLLGTSRGLGARFWTGALVAVMTSGTTASGLLLWPVGLVHLWWSDRQVEPALRRWRLGIWSAMGASLWFWYLNILSARTPLASRMHGILGVIPHLLVTAGAPLTRNVAWAGMLGGLFVLLYLLVAARMVPLSAQPRHPTIALPLMIFAVVNAALIGFGRRQYPLQLVLNDHFTAFTFQGIIGLYVALSVASGIIWAKAARIALLLVCLVALSRETVSSFRWAASDRTEGMRMAYYLGTYRFQPDSRLALLTQQPAESHPDWVRSGAPILEELKLNVFSEPALRQPQGAPLPYLTQSAVEHVNGRPLHQGQAVVERSETACEIEGWAVDSKLQAPAKGVFLQVDDGKFQVPGQYGIERWEMANPSLRHSGFYISFDPHLIGVGSHRAVVQIVAGDGRGYYSSGVFEIVVR
jgi:hypothetical protein